MAKSSSTAVLGTGDGSGVAATVGRAPGAPLNRSSVVGAAGAKAGGGVDTGTFARATGAVPGLGTTTQVRALTIAPRWALLGH